MTAARLRKLERAAERSRLADERARVARAALVSQAEDARADGVTIRAVAEAIGLSSSATYELLGGRRK